MSWLPDKDPVLGDKTSCDALELIVVPRVRDLGDGFSVRRALPHAKRQMVGPFIFFDQMGPVQLVPGRGMDVRPHPHIGLATVTYLFDGRVMHRDSEGNALEITPGAMGIVALVDRVWTTYGTGKTNSLGCVPQIGAVGTPGVSQPSGFEVRCTQLRNQTLGMLIYTVNGARAAVPFQCGTLLVGPTGIRRSPIRGSGGSSFPATDCSGVFALDMNAYAAGAAGGMPDPALSVPGNVVRAQWWGRDNGFAPPCNTTLSNAIEYTTRP